MEYPLRRVESVVSNPAYVGIGECPQYIPLNDWVEAALIRVEVHGLEYSIDQTVEQVKQTDGLPEPASTNLYIEIARERGAKWAFLYLIHDLIERTDSPDP
ncbi:hypothetical protein RH831_10670 [Halodesulfurarchaeum sp. HSR-GB]|uniref:hypothetical protein n=1 Tax=Halodesulfurarchaeum sp. HSR-GB TaxID=3074077 RepID=UPI00286520AC|nr:hypothetical protein [Halodesulfurarchaeum sp. HSR-GB]MDR5657640.1 hypothetical protein [Halodesulfurarchaeum sp. HSR-GB]